MPHHAEGKGHVLVGMDVDGGRPPGLSLANELRDLLEGLGAGDHVDVAAARPQALAFLLRDAAGDSDDALATCFGCEFPNFAEPRVELLFCALAHAAGVDDHDVRVRGRAGRGVSVGLEESGQTLGVVIVHLAAERLD